MLNVKLTLEQAFPKGAILAGTLAWYKYDKDGLKTDIQLGTKYIVVNRSGYDKINVKVKSLVPIMSKEEIEESEEDILITFEGFEASVFSGKDGGIYLSGKADKAVLV